MKIGFDLDDTLIDLVGAFIKYHNKLYGTHIDKRKINVYNMAGGIGISEKLVNERIENFCESSDFGSIPAIEGAVEAILKLREGNELSVITGRIKRYSGVTIDLVDRLFYKSFSAIRFSEKSRINRNSIDKGAVGEELKLRVFMEDGLHYAKQFTIRGIPVILYDAPWNQCSKEEEKEHGLIRAYSWKEVPDIIKSLSAFQVVS